MCYVAGMKGTQLKIELGRGVVSWDSKSLGLSPRLFRLYCLLAVARENDASAEGGSIEIDQVHVLPGWQNNELLSIGKQIRRHIQELDIKGIHLIEAVQKTSGPYRLAVLRSKIKIVGNRNLIPNILGHAAPAALPDSNVGRDLFAFVDLLARGSLALDDGDLELAQKEFAKAAKCKVGTSVHSLALLNLARASERRQLLPEAARICDQLIAELKKSKTASSWAMARAYTLQAWIRLRQGEVAKAKRQFQKALVRASGSDDYRLLGDVHNGIGTVEKRGRHFAEAFVCYQRALENWTLAQYWYGVQATYFNVGQMYYEWGKELEAVDSRSSQTHFETALHWIDLCISLCNRAGIGFDANDAEILQSSIYRKMGRFKNALEAAEAAMRLAEVSDGPRHRLGAFRAILKVHLATGNSSAVDSLMSEARMKLDASGIADLEQVIKATKHKPKSSI